MFNKNIKKANSKKDLIRNNIKLKLKNSKYINNNIFRAVENNNLEKLLEIIKSESSKINTLNNKGLSPLHISVMKANIDITYHLLLNGADPNIISSPKKQTPLHFAYIYQNQKTDKIIEKLKMFKANENIYDINNKRPIDYLNSNEKMNDINNKKDNKKNKSKDNNINKLSKNNTDINSDINFSKLNIKNERDEDNCEKENIDINERKTKKHCYQDNLINHINNQSKKEILITNLSDSLEEEQIEEKDNNLKFKDKNNSNICSRNKIIIKKNNNNKTHNYPNIFNNIIFNNINNKKHITKNKSYKENISNNENDSNKIIKKIDDVLKELIKKKRQSIKLKKNNSFYRDKTNDNTNDYNISKEKNLINETNIEYNKNKENYEYKKITDENNNIKINTIRNNRVLTAFTTEEQTKNKKGKEKITIITNKDVVEFKYADSFTEENNTGKKINNITNSNNNNNNINSNTSFNVLNKDMSTIKETEKYTNILTNINNKYSIELKNWLDNIGLSIYFQNFIENNICDINILINQMKNSETRLGYDDIESILKIHKPGHIYRLVCKLEVDSGLIKSNYVKFLIKNNKNKGKDNNSNNSNNNLKLSVSQEINNCVNCFKLSFFSSTKKNDLKSFLNRYELNEFYQNFYHNGFDYLNYVMLQMFSSDPIDEIILENCFHLYESYQREIVLNSLMSEKKKIKYFLNSNEYKNCEFKDIIKYEDIIFEENKNK